MLDRAAYAQSLVQEDTAAGTQTPTPESVKRRAAAVEQARREAARLHIRLALEEDGSFVVRYRFSKEEGSFRGTWVRQGERITLKTTHAPGGPLGTVNTTVVRYGPGELWFEAGAVPRPFVLRRE